MLVMKTVRKINNLHSTINIIYKEKYNWYANGAKSMGKIYLTGGMQMEQRAWSKFI